MQMLIARRALHFPTFYSFLNLGPISHFLFISVETVFLGGNIFIYGYLGVGQASQVMLVVKKLAASAGHVRDGGLIPGWGRSPGEGNGYPPQYSCLENPMDRGAWWATVHGAAELDPTERSTHGDRTYIVCVFANINFLKNYLFKQNQPTTNQTNNPKI